MERKLSVFVGILLVSLFVFSSVVHSASVDRMASQAPLFQTGSSNYEQAHSLREVNLSTAGRFARGDIHSIQPGHLIGNELHTGIWLYEYVYHYHDVQLKKRNYEPFHGGGYSGSTASGYFEEFILLLAEEIRLTWMLGLYFVIRLHFMKKRDDLVSHYEKGRFI